MVNDQMVNAYKGLTLATSRLTQYKVSDLDQSLTCSSARFAERDL